MLGRIAVIWASLLATFPAMAGELNFEQAKHLVAGKFFSYRCFDGTTGAGRIHVDGSVAGSIRVQGAGRTYHVALPAGTIHNRSGSVCATVRGLPISPCFNVVQTGSNQFRGSIWGLSFAYCDFTRRGARIELAGSRSDHRDRPITATSSTTAE
jgi:hypothetical protein